MFEFTNPWVRVIELLRKYGADPSQVNYQGRNASTIYEEACVLYTTGPIWSMIA